MFQLELFHFRLLLAEAVLPSELNHGLGLFPLLDCVLKPGLYIFAFQVPLKDLLRPLKEHSFHLELEVLDKAVLVLNKSRDLSFFLFQLFKVSSAAVFKLGDLVLVTLPL